MDWSDILARWDPSVELGELSKNPNLPFSLVRQYPKFRWNWVDLSSNPTLPFSYVVAHPEIKWMYDQVLMNSILSVEEVLSSGLVQLPGGWSWGAITGRFKPSLAPLSANRHISLTDILTHPELNWTKGYLSQNPNLTLEFLLAPPTTLLGDWNWISLSSNPAFPPSLQRRKVDLPWKVTWLSNSSLREEDLPEGEIDSDHRPFLLQNPSLTMRFIRQKIVGYIFNVELICKNSGREVSEILDLYQSMGYPKHFDWSNFLRYGGKPSALRVFRQIQAEKTSYLHYLPIDMAQAYFVQYLAPIPVSDHGPLPHSSLGAARYELAHAKELGLGPVSPQEQARKRTNQQMHAIARQLLPPR